MHILKGEGVCKYFGGLAAVLDVDFHVEEGEILGLIGPNGAGKTTLFNLISAALPHGSGVIHFNGEKISGRGRHEICKYGIARTFQSTKIFGSLTALENVMTPMIFQGITEIERIKRAEFLLESVGLKERMKHRPFFHPEKQLIQAYRGTSQGTGAPLPVLV